MWKYKEEYWRNNRNELMVDKMDRIVLIEMGEIKINFMKGKISRKSNYLRYKKIIDISNVESEREIYKNLNELFKIDSCDIIILIFGKILNENYKLYYFIYGRNFVVYNLNNNNKGYLLLYDIIDKISMKMYFKGGNEVCDNFFEGINYHTIDEGNSKK